jgi:hypothetical protein
MSASGARPVSGVFVLDRTGALRYTLDLSGDPPDPSLVSGFFASAVAFVRSMAGERLESVVLGGCSSLTPLFFFFFFFLNFIFVVATLEILIIHFRSPLPLPSLQTRPASPLLPARARC